MKIETSKNLCMFFALANLGLYLYNGLELNLYIGIAMVAWVIFLDFMRKH